MLPIKQLIRYGLVGIASNVFIYLGYLLITYLGVEAKLAMTLLYLIGVLIGFIGNRKWTFSYSGNSFSAAKRYALAHLLGYTVNLLILYIFVDHYGFAHQWVQAVAIFIVAGLLFLIFKFFVFSKKYGVVVENQ
ncbi:MAG: GtrA family protein [Gallionella sp.]